MIRITTRSVVAGALTVLLIAHTASANTMSWVNVPIPAGTAVSNPASEPAGLTNLDGFQSWNLTLDTTSDWTAALLEITLTSGSIFQEGEGFGANGVTLGQPDPAGFPVLPSSEFDSYIFDPHGGATVGDPAKDACGAIGNGCFDFFFDSTEVKIGWNSAGADTADIGIFSIARVTLSPDAQGTWSVRFTVSGSPEIFESTGGVVNGALVPEPATIGLLLPAGLGLLRRGHTKH